MSKIKNKNSSKITNKIKSSLGIRLNFNMLWRLFSAFISINICVCILILAVAIWKVEEGANNIVETISSTEGDTSIKGNAALGYSIVTTKEALEGIVLPNFLQKKLPLKLPNVIRSIEIQDDNNLFNSDSYYDNRSTPFLQKITQLNYNLGLVKDDLNFKISYPLGKDLRLFLSAFFILLLFELLILINDFRKGSKAIRKALKPLSDMAETARNLNVEVSSMHSRYDGTHIKNMAGVISGIDATRLDRTISVDSSQNELKDLASAINNMLNRIRASYESQVRFVSDASHELRTPISVIQGYANLLDRWGKDDKETMQESIDAIKVETQNMKELVEHLLFLARGDNETIHFQNEIFDVCDVIDEIVRETKMIDPNHCFEIDLARHAYLDADRQLIKQAMRILIDNSMKYTPIGGNIVLRITLEDGFVRILVQDSGIGIASEDLPYIFDRFYRSDESRARKTGGSGLGLSIAKWIIERHGGHFEVLSRLDVGTRIICNFPKVND